MPSSSTPAHPRGHARNAIVTHARALFSAVGYEATMMRDVAQAAQVSEALLYRYFPTKAILFEQAIVEPYQSFVGAFLNDWEQLDEQLPNDEMVSQFVRRLYDFVETHRELVIAMLANSHYGERVNDVGILSSGVHRLAHFTAGQAAARGIDHVDLEMAVACTIAMVFSMATLEEFLFPPGTEHPDRERLVDQMCRYAAAGVQQRQN